MNPRVRHSPYEHGEQAITVLGVTGTPAVEALGVELVAGDLEDRARAHSSGRL